MPVGNPAPPRPRSPLCWISSMICSGRAVRRHRRRAAKPSCRRYSSRSVGSIWPQYSVARCCCGPRNAHTGPSRGSIACRAIGSLVLVGQQPVQPAPARRSRSAAASSAGWKCCSTSDSDVLGLDTWRTSWAGPPRGTISTSGVWWHMPTQPTRLTHGRGAGLGQHVLDGLVDLAAALGDAAGAQPDADLADRLRRRPRPAASAGARARCCCCRKSCDAPRRPCAA